MRIAILSDIHSNLQALRRALELVEKLRADEIYCLGDIVGYGGNPNECVDLVRRRASRCVLGNHDLAAVNTSHANHLDKHGNVAALWTHKVLTEGNKEYLSSLPFVFEETDLATLVHATPGTPELWKRIDSLEDAGAHFGSFETPLCFTGHSHIPFICGEDLRTFQVKRGLRFLINVGSVGQPRDQNPQLSFGCFDTEEWTFENIRAKYDIVESAKAIREAGLPAVLAERLFLGV
jgi:predicted phosphodiesterase